MSENDETFFEAPEIDEVFADDWPEDHRSGVVAVVGRPNVGKSSLINAILGQKVAIATPKPQTTRRQQLGIYTVPEGQILFIDTPGMHKPHNKLGEYMAHNADNALRDADVIVWILDATEPPHGGDQYIAEKLLPISGRTPIILVLNKTDLLKGVVNFTAHLALIPDAPDFKVSAKNGTRVSELLERLLQMVPLGPRYYPTDQVSDMNMRFVASEIIREKIINLTDKEIPHSVAVEVDSFVEEEDRATISAVIYCERDSQKGILVGKGGAMIKKIGIEARRDLIEQMGVAVHLDLRVKVLANWRDDEALMRRVGYRIPKEDDER